MIHLLTFTVVCFAYTTAQFESAVQVSPVLKQVGFLAAWTGNTAGAGFSVTGFFVIGLDVIGLAVTGLAASRDRFRCDWPSRGRFRCDWFSGGRFRHDWPSHYRQGCDWLCRHYHTKGNRKCHIARGSANVLDNDSCITDDSTLITIGGRVG